MSTVAKGFVWRWAVQSLFTLMWQLLFFSVPHLTPPLSQKSSNGSRLSGRSVISDASAEIEISQSERPVTPSGSFSELSVDSTGSSYDAILPTQESLNEAQNLVISRLKQQLCEAENELIKKNEKCDKLSHMQTNVDNEIHDLTQSLFEEAYKMTNAAKGKQLKAEKMLVEANLKIDGLQAEVDALKLLVLYNTPSNSNNSSPRGKQSTSNGSKSKLSFLGHRRNNSDSASTSWVCSQCKESEDMKMKRKQLDTKEVDPIFHKEFTEWRAQQDLGAKDEPFLKRVYENELMPCLAFENTTLGEQVLTAIELNTIEIEATNEEKPVVRCCSLTLVPRICPFRLRCTAEGDWHYVSNMCRNRIATVCDFFTYLRYLQKGLIKCGLHESYWRVIKLRKNMALARLGLGIIPTQGRQDSP